jgi:protein-L-isoaspartate(D-aspartate) O-methyltransferase
VVSAGGTKIPGSLQGQLAVGGRLVIPVEEGVDGQRLRLVRRVEVDRYESSDLGRVSFVPLIGREA